MFSDMNTSKGLNAKFKTHLDNSDTTLNSTTSVCGVFLTVLAVDFTTLILSTGSWPFNQGYELQLPETLLRGIDRFTTFYTVRGIVMAFAHPWSCRKRAEDASLTGCSRSPRES